MVDSAEVEASDDAVCPPGQCSDYEDPADSGS
jgi:hypothetical protein